MNPITNTPQSNTSSGLTLSQQKKRYLPSFTDTSKAISMKIEGLEFYTHHEAIFDLIDQMAACPQDKDRIVEILIPLCTCLLDAIQEFEQLENDTSNELTQFRTMIQQVLVSFQSRSNLNKLEKMEKFYKLMPEPVEIMRRKVHLTEFFCGKHMF